MTKSTIRMLGVLLVALFASACPADNEQKAKTVAPAKSGKALFEEKCRTVAGEKIYRKVEDVEGVLLLKVRPRRGERALADPMWPGAAFGRELAGDGYITSFLGYEHSASPKGEPVTPAYRGYITTDYQPKNPSNLPGYRYVDVIDETDGKRYRYSGSVKVVGRKDTKAPAVARELQANPNLDLNVYRWTLDKTPASDPAPRYGVTFEDHVIPQERALWVASSTVKVLDLKTNEVLGEMTRYAWSPGLPSPANPSSWLTAWRCPDHAVGTGEATRKFADQILMPRREK